MISFTKRLEFISRSDTSTDNASGTLDGLQLQPDGQPVAYSQSGVPDWNLLQHKTKFVRAGNRGGGFNIS